MATRLFSSCFSDSITEKMYDADLAGLSFNLEFTSKVYVCVYVCINAVC